MTLRAEVSSDPIDLVDSLSLTTGTWYNVQYLGGGTYAFVKEAATKPDGQSAWGNAISTASQDSFEIQPDGTNGIWVWTESGHAGAVIVQES